MEQIPKLIINIYRNWKFYEGKQWKQNISSQDENTTTNFQANYISVPDADT